MTMTLPSELTWALSQLGFDWPESDEDKLDAMGQAWTSFAGTLRGLVDEADKQAQLVWSGNRGEAITAFQNSWSGGQAPVASLREGADAAALIGAGCSAAAAIVVALKLKIIAEVAFFVRTCYIAAQAAKTPWTAAGAVAVVIAVRIMVQKAIEAAFNLAIEMLLHE